MFSFWGIVHYSTPTAPSLSLSHWVSMFCIKFILLHTFNSMHPTLLLSLSLSFFLSLSLSLCLCVCFSFFCLLSGFAFYFDLSTHVLGPIVAKCLYWATMFNDRCFYRDLGKNLSGTDAYYKSARGSHLDAPRRPCRSFCLAVGLTCANDPFSWVNLCHNIDCPVEAEMCARSGNRTNAVREGAYEDGSTDCYVYKFASAYSAATHGRGDWRWVFAFTFSLVYFSISGQQ